VIPLVVLSELHSQITFGGNFFLRFKSIRSFLRVDTFVSTTTPNGCRTLASSCPMATEGMKSGAITSRYVTASWSYPSLCLSGWIDVVKYTNQNIFPRFTHCLTFTSAILKKICGEPVFRVHAYHPCRRSCRSCTANLQFDRLMGMQNCLVSMLTLLCTCTDLFLMAAP
jgi:hypothetical protein